MPGPLDGMGGVVRHDLADDQPVEQHPDRGELLLDRGRGVRAAQLLDPGGDMDRPDRRQAQAHLPAPGEEAPGGAGVGGAGVRVADPGGEELDVADGSALAGGCHQGRQMGGRSEGSGRGRDHTVVSSEVVWFLNLSTGLSVCFSSHRQCC